MPTEKPPSARFLRFRSFEAYCVVKKIYKLKIDATDNNLKHCRDCKFKKELQRLHIKRKSYRDCKLKKNITENANLKKALQRLQIKLRHCRDCKLNQGIAEIVI